MPSPLTLSSRWDIFCRVVDNFGDIGVCWRLARQLAAEYSQEVRLWVDEPAAFLRICPEAEFIAGAAQHAGVAICPWPVDWSPTRAEDVAEVVIEAFGCDLPEPYIAAMVEAKDHRARSPLWLNLEYLSAEDWVEGCHGLPSPQANGLTKTFFFPGFSEETGGLLREVDLLARRRAFQADPAAKFGFLARLGVFPPMEALLVSLFCYDNPALPVWMDALGNRSNACFMLIPEGRVSAAVAAHFGVSELRAGDLVCRGKLSVIGIPFLSQEDYDRLLWCCDLNLVRGEDSFVRAQWAGRPLLWHIYPQQDGAHLAKLSAFMDRYTAAMTPEQARALRALWQSFNIEGPPPDSEWLLSLHNSASLRHAEAWCDTLGRQKNLAETLVRFYRNWL